MHQICVADYRSGGMLLLHFATAQRTARGLLQILSEDKTKELVITKIQELNVTSMAELGKLMQYMKKQPTGTIDLSLVSKLAKEILA